MNIPKDLRKILFVCHGNICRSPMAEFVMKDLLAKAGITGVTVESAALRADEIGNDIHHGTKSILVKYAIPFASRAAWRLTPAKAAEYDIIVGMDAYNMADLKRLVYPADLPKICKMLELAGLSRDVADPWFTGDFEATYADVLAGCSALLESMKGQSAQS
jgi:protein-tyrosine phosphatase